MVKEPNVSTKFVVKISKPEPCSLFDIYLLKNNVILLLLICWHPTYIRHQTVTFSFPQLPHVTVPYKYHWIFLIILLPQKILPVQTSGLLNWEEYLGNWILKYTFNQYLLYLAWKETYFIFFKLCCLTFFKPCLNNTFIIAMLLLIS